MRGQGRTKGRGQGGGFGLGPGGECICPNCDHRESHQLGVNAIIKNVLYVVLQ